jgi:hypothetical protein
MSEATRDTGGVDTAIMALLASDQTLVDLLGSANAVFADVAPQGQTRFVIVSVIEHLDAYEFLTSAYETAWVMVKVVMAGTARASAKAAAARCHALLQGGDALAVPGYRVMDVTRERFVDGTEYDERSQTWWQHVGGLFVVQLTPDAAEVAV